MSLFESYLSNIPKQCILTSLNCSLFYYNHPALCRRLFLKLDFVGTGNEADVAYDFIHQGRDILNDVYGGRSTNRINPGRGTNTTDLSSLMPIDETFAASTASTAGEQAANSAAHNGGKQRGQFQKLKKN